MPGVVANRVAPMGTTYRNAFSLRNDFPETADLFYRLREILSPKKSVGAPQVLAFGVSPVMLWAYDWISYVPVESEEIKGGASRPSVGQLTP